MEQEDRGLKVSYFSNVNDVTPKETDLINWLKDTINPPESIKKLVLKYRDSFSRKDKEKIPCITVSATFKSKRNLNNIKEKTGLICIDIDRFSKKKKAKSNDCVDMNLVKEKFMTHPSCLYVGYSCSGDGVYAIFKINPEVEIINYFNYFLERLNSIGLNIDESCKDYTRLRFFSFDEEAYLNVDAKILNIQSFDKEKEIKKEEIKEVYQPISDEKRKKAREVVDNFTKAKKIEELVLSTRTDITQSYDDWVKVGAGLFNEFGEDGREIFHNISSMNDGYKCEECDKKYNQCKGMTKIKFNTFLHIASSYGVRY